MLDSVLDFAAAIASGQYENWSWVHVIFASLFFGGFAWFSELFFRPTGWGAAFWRHGKPFTFPEMVQFGKILTDDDFGWKDTVFISFNRFVVTPCYFTHMIRHFHASDNFSGPFDGSSWFPPLVLPLHVLALLVIYDSVYVPFHRFLHLPEVYPWIHKHHHKTIAPHRGTLDGVNAHPIEMACGEFLHLFSCVVLEMILSKVGPVLGIASKLHWTTVAVMFVVTAVEASLNHTQIDVRVPGFFDTRDHSVHHRLLKANYFQYTRWWDMCYGTYYSGEEMVSRWKAQKVG